MQELEENAYLERLGVEMIELRDCIVGVKDKKEYEKVIQIAKRQGCEWNSGDSLDYIYCPFPTRLRFNGECKVYYNSSAYYYNRDYKCKEIVGALRNMILKRKEGQLC